MSECWLMHVQATSSQGRVVERADAWCGTIGVPYFRFNPPLSENVPLDCKDDARLVNMLWETQCYIHENRDRIVELAKLLKTKDGSEKVSSLNHFHHVH